MKKLVAFALILGLGMFSVVGCSHETKTEPAKKPPTEKQNPEKTPPAPEKAK
jgi:PBP1b-binding outer membrane lipoprotein LpoB